MHMHPTSHIGIPVVHVCSQRCFYVCMACYMSTHQFFVAGYVIMHTHAYVCICAHTYEYGWPDVLSAVEHGIFKK